MDFLNEGLFCRAKALVSALCEMIVSTSSLPYHMQNAKQQYWPKHPGLKILIYSSPQKPTRTCFILQSYMLPSVSTSSSATSTAASLIPPLTECSINSPWSSVLDELIGTESGVYSAEQIIAREEKHEPYYHPKQEKRNRRGTAVWKKQYPPPIPLLAQTGNLPGHMPWVLTREYVDGKLILVGERVEHHDYFEAHRENGRLTLNLVSLDNILRRSRHCVYEEKEELELQDMELIEEEDTHSEEEEDVTDDAYDQEKEDGSTGVYVDSLEAICMVDKIMNKRTKTTLAYSIPKSYLKNVEERSGALRNCFTYSGKMMSNAEIFCDANVGHRNARAYMPESTSAPLTFMHVCPVTVVPGVA